MTTVYDYDLLKDEMWPKHIRFRNWLIACNACRRTLSFSTGRKSSLIILFDEVTPIFADIFTPPRPLKIDPSLSIMHYKTFSYYKALKKARSKYNFVKSRIHAKREREAAYLERLDAEDNNMAMLQSIVRHGVHHMTFFDYLLEHRYDFVDVYRHQCSVENAQAEMLRDEYDLNDVALSHNTFSNNIVRDVEISTELYDVRQSTSV